MASLKPANVTSTPILSVPPPPHLTHTLSPQLSRSSPPLTHVLSSSYPSTECTTELCGVRSSARKHCRRVVNLVDIRSGSGVAGSSVELGTVSHPQPPHLLQQGKRARAPLADLDSKFVVSKSGLCLSNDGQASQSHSASAGGEFLRGGSVRGSHHGPGGSPSLGGGEGGSASLRGASLEDGGSRFPRLDQCAHFHYEYVELPPISVCLVSEDLKPLPRGTSRSASVDSKQSSDPDSHSSFTDGIIGSLAAECENYIDGAVSAEEAQQNTIVDPENKENTELVAKTALDASPRPGTSLSSCVAEVHADSSPLPSDVSRNSKPDSPSMTSVLSASKVQQSTSVISKGPKAPDANQSIDDSESKSFLVQVTSLGRSWVVRRTYENFRFLDRQLHRCCYDRKVSRLSELPPEDQMPVHNKESALESLASAYLAQLSNIAGPLITCGPVLGWLELDNRGHRLIVTDDSDINTPAVAAAYVVKRYVAQASDEISFEVGDMISVIDMPPAEESVWWRGKRGFQVGFFPYECVQVIGDKVPQALHPAPLQVTTSRCPPSSPLQRRAAAPTKPVLKKHGKLIAFFRSFILSRPSRRKLKRQGILKERVFGCDLGEHLSNSGHNLPMVLKCCAEFIESHGTVDGIYRLSGITSNIQKLRNAFDEDRIPDLYGDESILQDIHCVGSVLKMYFRELPNPLLTYQLYESFVAAVTQSEEERLLHVRDVVRQLPPPNSRTLEYLIRHLARVACHSSETGMTPKNIAIVWAPNLLRCKELEEGGVAALQDVGTQAVVTEYLIRYVELIFCEQKPSPSPRPIRFGTNVADVTGTPKKSRPKSLAISTPTKLLTIEEARLRALTAAIKPDQKYIEVGGGPQSLPKTYHTVIELPNRKGGSLKQKKSPMGWKNFFSKGRTVSKQTLPELQQQQRKISSPCDFNLTVPACGLRADVTTGIGKQLRPVKSEESLASTPASHGGSSNRNSQAVATPENGCGVRQSNGQAFNSRPRNEKRDSKGTPADAETGNSSNGSPIPSPRTHNRSVSHDSYFNLLDKEGGKPPREGAVAEEGESDLELSPESSSKMFLDISELNIDFNTSEPEMKIFSEDETLRSTSIEESLSRSTLDMENLSMGSGSTKSKENIHRFDKRSLKDKLRHKFTSPALSRKEFNAVLRNEAKSESLSSEGNSRSTKDSSLSPNVASREGVLLSSPFRGTNVSDVKLPLPKPGENKLASQTDPESVLSTEQDKSVASDGTTEGGNLSFEDTRSERSFESTLIDPELMAKLTKIQSSPSATASEESSASLAEATVSDNESFTLGSSASNGGIANPIEVPAQLEVSSKKETETNGAHETSESQLTVTNPIVAIMTESCPGNLDSECAKNEDTLSLGETKSERIDVSQRPSSLYSEAEGLLNVGQRGGSPETPQGDSTFLDIQYHPLSDTTEPSTPSESHFGNGATEASTPVATSMPSFPKRGTPLSPDISSSSADDPVENVPIYENVEASSELYSSFIHQCEEEENNYENVLYQSSAATTKNGDDQSIHVTNTIIRKKSLPKKSKSSKSGQTSESVDNGETVVCDDEYENLRSSENSKTGLLETALDDYETYNFQSQPEYENVTLRNRQAKEYPNQPDKELGIEIDGEIVYEQVKYLRKSIQEVNDLLGSNEKLDSLPTDEPANNEAPAGALMPPTSTKPVGSAKCPSPHKFLESADDTECLESPMTPSSSSLPTEVLVFPSFSSPTESTTDDVTSSDASETVPTSGSSFRRSPTFIPRLSPKTVTSSQPFAVDDFPLNGSSSSDRRHSNAKEFSASLEFTSDSPGLENRSSVPCHSVVLPHLSVGSSTRSSESSSPQSNPALSQVTSASSETASISSCSPDLTPTGESLDLPLVPVSQPSVLCASSINDTEMTTGFSKDSEVPPDNTSSTLSDTKTSEQCQPLLVIAPTDSTIATNIPSSPESSQNENDLVLTGHSSEMQVECLDKEEIDTPTMEDENPSAVTPEVEIVTKHPIQALQRHKTAPDIPKPQILMDNAGQQSKEAEDVPAKAKSDPGQSTEITSALIVQEDEATKRERIEKYKEERRMFLREKFKSESFRGERDEMLLRLKQKATSPSRAEDDVFLNDECPSDPTMQGEHDLSADFSRKIDATQEVENSKPVEFRESRSVTENISLFSSSNDDQIRPKQEKNCPRSSSTSQLPEKLKQINSLNRHSSPSPPTSNVVLQSASNNASSNNKCTKVPSSSFVRSSNTRNSGGRKKGAGLMPDTDDISVKDRVSVWGKELASQKTQSDNTSTSKVKYETGLYFGGQSNKEAASDKPPRFNRGMSHDPATSRPPADASSSHARVSRVASCSPAMSEAGTVTKPSKLMQCDTFSGRNGNSAVKSTPSSLFSAGNKALVEQTEKVSGLGADNGKILAGSDRNEASSVSKNTDFMSSKPTRTNVAPSSIASATKSFTSATPPRVPQSSNVTSNSRGASLAVSNKVSASATLSKPSAVSQQQRKIRDMAAMFEAPGSGSTTASGAASTTKVLKQSLREGK